MKIATLAGLLGAGAFASATSADIVHFVNPAPDQPGHYDWRFDWWTLEPSWLDITRAPSDQMNVPSGAAVGQLFAGEGDADYNMHEGGAHLLAMPSWGGWSFTQCLAESDPVASAYPYGWFDTSAHAAASFSGPHSSFFPSGVPSYMGVRTAAGQLGWIMVVFEIDDLNFRALEWAYQTEPGVPIVAGQIPAPASLALCGLGACMTMRRRRS